MSETRRKGIETPELTPAELLDSSPFEGDLAAELAAAPPRRRLPSLTVFLGAAVLLVAGFLGGIQADKQWGGKQASAAPAAPTGTAQRGGQRGAGFGTGLGNGFGTGRSGSGSATVGTVKLVDGTTIYVQTASGGVVPVKTSGLTRISVSKSGTAQDIKPGATVLVQGTPGADGTVNASTVNEGSTR